MDQAPLPDDVRSAVAQLSATIKQGGATLFLGAGASASAIDNRGNRFPTGLELAEELQAQFCPHLPRGQDLETLCELLPGYQRADAELFVANRLRGAYLSPWHDMIPWFRWTAILTTNYDSVIQDSYARARFHTQKLVLIDKDENLRFWNPYDPESLPVIMLHGTIYDPSAMVLSMTDLHASRRLRGGMVRTVESIHLKSVVIYIGYSFRDRYILDMVFDIVGRQGQRRGGVVLVTPGMGDGWDDRRKTWWEERTGGTYIPCDFQQFMECLREGGEFAAGDNAVAGHEFAPCTSRRFAGSGVSQVAITEKDGSWVCRWTYKIDSEEGFAGVAFDRLGEPADVSMFDAVEFDLRLVGDHKRRKPIIDAIKLESDSGLDPNYMDIGNHAKDRWVHHSVPLDVYKHVDLRRVKTLAFGDNGHRAELGQTYVVEIKNIHFTCKSPEGQEA